MGRMSETTSKTYTFSASGFPRLVEFDRMVGEKTQESTMIFYRIIGTPYFLRFFRFTWENADSVSLRLTDRYGAVIESKAIKVPEIRDTRSAKKILEANGFTLIYSESRAAYLLAEE